jgi:hypothetical protein
MALYLIKHPNGPDLPDAFKDKRFRSFVDMANYADEHELPEGKYYSRNPQGSNLLTAIREVTRKGSGFHVEGRGNI